MALLPLVFTACMSLPEGEQQTTATYPELPVDSGAITFPVLEFADSSVTADWQFAQKELTDQQLQKNSGEVRVQAPEVLLDAIAKEDDIYVRSQHGTYIFDPHGFKLEQLDPGVADTLFFRDTLTVTSSVALLEKGLKVRKEISPDSSLYRWFLAETADFQQVLLRKGEREQEVFFLFPTLNPELQIERDTFLSYDGTRIGLELIMQPGNSPAYDTPLLMYVQDGFTEGERPTYPELLQQHIREGGALVKVYSRGQGGSDSAWLQAGIGSRLQLRFDDIQAGLEYLHRKRIGQPKKTIVWGRRTGALSTAIMLRQRPLVAAALVLEDGPYDLEAYQRLGNGRQYSPVIGGAYAEDRSHLKKYSPLSDLTEGYYPAVLCLSGRDDLFGAAHAAKLIAGLQKYSTAGGPYLLLEKSDPVQTQVQVAAFMNAFQ